MIQTWDSRRYTFKAAVTDQCPDCGKYSVRPATEAEQAEYWKVQEEINIELCLLNKY